MPPLRNISICSPRPSALDVTAHSFNPMFDESGSMGDIGIECLTTFKLEKVSVVAFCEYYTEIFDLRSVGYFLKEEISYS